MPLLMLLGKILVCLVTLIMQGYNKYEDITPSRCCRGNHQTRLPLTAGPAESAVNTVSLGLAPFYSKISPLRPPRVHGETSEAPRLPRRLPPPPEEVRAAPSTRSGLPRLSAARDPTAATASRGHPRPSSARASPAVTNGRDHGPSVQPPPSIILCSADRAPFLWPPTSTAPIECPAATHCSTHCASWSRPAATAPRRKCSLLSLHAILWPGHMTRWMRNNVDHITFDYCKHMCCPLLYSCPPLFLYFQTHAHYTSITCFILLIRGDFFLSQQLTSATPLPLDLPPLPPPTVHHRMEKLTEAFTQTKEAIEAELSDEDDEKGSVVLWGLMRADSLNTTLGCYTIDMILVGDASCTYPFFSCV
ncbi:uncharacterized protein [Aegilops tauschii subsp. strangulata]|uniref:uncharacterized protein n=1 Tax=Aegilops tauschii subsp. strangulata TaxID=200361 RepID=UPI003CC875AF